MMSLQQINIQQFNIITQKNCDLSDTSIMQADELISYMNVNCEYDTAVNVSINNMHIKFHYNDIHIITINGRERKIII